VIPWPVLQTAKFAVCCLALLGCVAPSAAQEVLSARPGHEYRVIEQPPGERGEHVEVIEFFWYGCPYCWELQASLEEWLKRKPGDVTLRRVPALLGDSRLPHARIYYALEALGELDRLHQQVYHGYHVEGLPMGKPDVVAQWAVRHGITREKWLDAYNSDAVVRKSLRARELTLAHDVQGTPSIVVDGRYLTSSSMTGGARNMMPMVDALIHIARQQRAAK
jgi:protein dithiol oxidoreductase (disulfide-forming)